MGRPHATSTPPTTSSGFLEDTRACRKDTLFSEITKNWRGRPLDSYETVLNHLRTTKTKTGLAVTACLLEGNYPLKLKVSKEDKAALNILRPHGVMPQWNYVIRPN